MSKLGPKVKHYFSNGKNTSVKVLPSHDTVTGLIDPKCYLIVEKE